MFTNLDNHGGKFLDVVSRELQNADSVRIASGYTSLDILNRFREDLERIAENGGRAQLLLGMAFYEGLSSNKLRVLKELAERLESYGGQSGVFVTYSQRYHGKVYSFGSNNVVSNYVGSSNFSKSGLVNNIEVTAPITDETENRELNQFLEFLFNQDNAVSILQADIIIPGTSAYRERVALTTLDDLDRYAPESIDKSNLQSFEVDLRRLAETEKSNLNAYFGKGRWSRATGRVKPRPWYEVEIISPVGVTSNPLYPKGDFLVYTDDGYVIPMKTSGANFKNMRSRGNLQIFGMWIKGKLQRNQALLPLTPVTADTLDAYGKDVIKLYKIRDGEYYMEF